MSRLWLRKLSLIVSQGTTPGNKALDLSQLKIHFNIYAADQGAPRTAVIRIMNPKRETASLVQKEFQYVSLAGGYEGGPFGTLFSGNVKLVRTGKLNSLDSFLELSATDGDRGLAFGAINKSLAAGCSAVDEVRQCIASMNGVDSTISEGDLTALTSTATAGLNSSAGGSSSPAQSAEQATGGLLSIRGKTKWGLATRHLDEIADRTETSWFIEQGKLYFVRKNGYIDDGQPPIEINSATGMVGIPTVTNDGLEVTTLLQPNIRLNRRIKLNRNDITTTFVQGTGFPTNKSVPSVASVASDGIYRVIVIEHAGGNRENEYHTKLVALSLDGSAPVNNSVVFNVAL